MQVNLAYGEKGLLVDLPETPGFMGILESRPAPACPDPETAYLQALRQPIDSPSLDEAVKKLIREKGDNATAVIVISDITRPVPNQFLLPPLLKILEKNGIFRKNIAILIGTGIHRPNEGEDLIALVGKDIAANYRILNHNSRRREDLADCGVTKAGIPVIINRHYLNADFKILTGFIEPHMWAGYSGGRKSILPGVASLETMKYMHGYSMVAHPETRYGVLEGNPFHKAGLEVMQKVGADFLVNVTLDPEKRITGFWCGDPVNAHLKGCRFLEMYCTVDLPEPLDFVVTTNAGAPLDCNLYQTVKGATGAALVVREGGVILIASACHEGLGSREYCELVEDIASPGDFLKKLMEPGFFVPDQWCAQELWQILLTKEVHIKTDGIPTEWLKKRGLIPVQDVSQAVKDLLTRFGPDARWAVIPHGPLVITRLQTPSNLS